MTNTKNSFSELVKKFEELSQKQKEWVRHKANWEHMTINAILEDYTIPLDEELDDNA